jgi:hypothetical protein
MIWKGKDMKYNRFLFLLQVSAHRTKDKEFGLLLTPTTKEDPVNLEKFKKRMEKYPNGTTMPNLATQILGMLPTPTCIDSTKNGDMTGAAKMLMGATMRHSGQQIQKTLTDAIQMEILKNNSALAMELASEEYMKRTKLPSQVEFVDWIKTIANQKEISAKTKLTLTKVEHWYRKGKVGFSYPTIEDWIIIKNHYQVPIEMDYKMTYQESIEWKGMLPTPNASEYRDTGENVKTSNFKQMNLTRTIAKDNPLWGGKNSQLSPLFVEEMMGFPKNWTTSPFLNGEKNQSKPTETP